MKDYYKKANLYYTAVPLVAMAFVIFVAAISLPAAGRKWKKKQDEYLKAKSLIEKIVKLDPERLNYKARKGASGEFDYSTAVVEITKLVKISSSNYSLRGHGVTKSGGKLRKSADITIEKVNIEKLSQFISQILLRWPDLKCDRLSIDKDPGGKDLWKATMKFVYTYQ
ncbi:MAG: hypothetical protein DRP66_09520 [Planctomycetota bacterium]|nr:MAG: hypothetical protein DRP66_09520 [Planctomycetota bacterium]